MKKKKNWISLQISLFYYLFVLASSPRVTFHGPSGKRRTQLGQNTPIASPLML